MCLVYCAFFFVLLPFTARGERLLCLWLGLACAHIVTAGLAWHVDREMGKTTPPEEIIPKITSHQEISTPTSHPYYNSTMTLPKILTLTYLPSPGSSLWISGPGTSCSQLSNSPLGGMGSMCSKSPSLPMVHPPLLCCCRSHRLTSKFSTSILSHA